jgi:molecular chaperone IbpA
MRSFDLSPLFRYSVGFDRLDDLFETAFRNTQEVSYPPYNIVKTGQDHYKIILAVAGFGESDLDVVVKENVLTVRGKVNDAEKEKDVTYLHRGIAGRSFEHRFQLADHVRVNGANLANGLLDIELVRELPEAMKPQRIEIGAGTTQPKVIEGKVKAAQVLAAVKTGVPDRRRSGTFHLWRHCRAGRLRCPAARASRQPRA